MTEGPKKINDALGKVLKRLHYPIEVMLVYVRWYAAYPLSLRNLEEMMAERGVAVDHTTVHRWAVKMLPILAAVMRRRKRHVGSSWRMDETGSVAIRISAFAGTLLIANLQGRDPTGSGQSLLVFLIATEPRVGEDVSERLDIVPAQFFVHRHIRGKWVCKCCQILVQEPVEPQIIDGGMPAAGLVAHTLVSRFVDHLPYYRQESINARSNVHTPRSTLAAWSGRGGASLQPLFDVHREFVLGAQVLHADETPVDMLDPGAGKTKKAYVWAYARACQFSGFDAQPGVAYDFCVGRGAKYPTAFLHGWTGTLVRDEFKGYESVLKQDGRTGAGCLAHARRKFDELIKVNQSPVAQQAVQRIALIYRVEREAQGLSADERLAMRQARSRPLWEELHVWLRLERSRVPEGSAIARAIDYSLNAWVALTAHLHDGRVPVDNNHIENLMRPWAMGRKAWLFAGSELAGQRAAVVMSLVQSAKLCGHDPWAYLKDVLTRLPMHLNSRIGELLPHLWQPTD